MQERICYVHPDGTPTGETAPKLDAHTADTKLHLAFSSYIFNDDGLVLVTQRALTKKVWPGVWTNSCCGHPLPGESIESAISRRLQDELGMTATDLQPILPSYTYKAPPYNGIVEHEFCPVYFGRATSEPQPNPDEVMALEWLNWEAFIARTGQDGEDYALPLGAPGAAAWSWWCKDQLKQIQSAPAAQTFIQ